MKHFYTKAMTGAFLLAASLTATTAAAQKAVLDAATEVYGDWMFGGDNLSSSQVNYYNSQNQLLRQATYDADGLLGNYVSYEYNENGLLTVSINRYWNLGNNGIYAFAADPDSTTYTYNAEGQLIQKVEPSYTTNYTYNADGALVSEVEYYRSSWAGEETLSQQDSIVYSDFLTKDCPQKAEHIGNYENYVATLSYTTDGKLLQELDSTSNGDGTMTFKKSTTNVYDDQGTLLYTVHKQSQAIYDYDTWDILGYEIVPIDSIVYTADGDLRTKEQTYTYSSYDSTWSNPTVYNVYVKREYDGSLANGVNVKAAEGLNNNLVTLTSVNMEETGVAYDLYRDGQKIYRFDLDEDYGVYVDSAVVNGEHEYFVQTVKTGEKEEGYNISNIVLMTNNLELPAPTNVRGVSKKIETDNSYMTIAWDAPAYTDDMKFVGYNIMSYNSYGDSFYNTTEPNQQETSFTFEMYNFYTEKENIYIQAVYEYGTANSDTVTIAMADLPEVTDAIGSVKGASTTISYRNATISLSDAANVRILDAAGKVVAEGKNATSVSLEAAPKGVYVVAVERNGKLDVMKVHK